ISAASASTAWATSAELTADSATTAPGSTARSAVSQDGSRYSATVMLAAMRSRSKPVRSDTRAGRGISRAYDLIADSALPELAAGGDAGSMAQILDLAGAGTVG